jgi:hypothetical protein
LRSEPTLSALHHHLEVLALLHDGIGEGLGKHAWSETELLEMQNTLATADLSQHARLAFQMQRAMENRVFNLCADAWPAGRRLILAEKMGGRPAPPIFSWYPFFPRSVFRDSQLRYNQWMDSLLQSFSDESPNIPDGPPVRLDKPSSYEQWGDTIYHVPAILSILDLQQSIAHLNRTQKGISLARLAIALERFWLKHGSYPEKLSDLLPDFIDTLPVDMDTGEPPSYTRMDGDTFMLQGPPTRGATYAPRLGERGFQGWPYAPTPKSSTKE